MLPPSPAVGPDSSGESDAGLDELRDLLDEGVVPEPEVTSDQGSAQSDASTAQPDHSTAQPAAQPGPSAPQPDPGVAQPAASAPQYDKMSTHRTVVAVFIGLNGLVIGGGAVVIAVAITFVASLGGGATDGLLVFAGMLGLGVLVLASVAAIRFARYGDRGGRVVAWITAVLYVLAFPVGTPIGAYMIWVLTRPNSAPPVQVPTR